MIQVLLTDINLLTAFWLCFSKWLMIIVQSPILDATSIPGPVKILCTLLITFAFFSETQMTALMDLNQSGIGFLGLTIYYVVSGIIIGNLIKSVMAIFVSAGSVITQQVGFSAMRYFDPSYSQALGPFEKVIQWVVIIVVLFSGALLPIFKGAYLSFSSTSFLAFDHLFRSPTYFLDFFKEIFHSAILLSSPLLFTNLFITLVLGILARAVPQLNILMVSFIINIGVGLFVFLATSTEFFHVAFKMYTDMLGQWFQYIT